MHQMMMFHTHTAIAINMIALVSGVLLLNKSCSPDFFCKKTGKIVGGLVSLIAILSIGCIAYHSMKTCCQKGEMKTDAWRHPAIEAPAPHALPQDDK
ncbi:MAG: hypothetical protein Q7S98_01395 [Deltaproteobacteria bacterium]|nr:hypothetical protein [Deltaproteobacteria bacterium]